MMASALFIALAFGIHTQGQADAQIRRASDCIAKQGALIADLGEEKEKVLQELRNGEFCSKCNQSKSELEKGGMTFEQHLHIVKGHPIPASPLAIKSKAREFDQKINSAQQQLNSCQREREQAIQERQRQEAEQRAQQQRAREEAHRREQEKRQQALVRQEEQQRKVEEERARQVKEIIEKHNESTRRINDALEDAKNKMLARLNRTSKEGDQQARPNNDKKALNNASDDFEQFHKKSLERLEENRKFYEAHPGYTGPPPERSDSTPIAPPKAVARRSDSTPSSPPVEVPRRDFKQPLFEHSEFSLANRDAPTIPAGSADDAETAPIRIEMKDVIRATAQNLIQQIENENEPRSGEAFTKGFLDTVKESVANATTERFVEWAKHQSLFGGRSYYELPPEQRRNLETGYWLGVFAKRLLERDANGAADAHNEFQERAFGQKSIDELLDPIR